MHNITTKKAVQEKPLRHGACGRPNENGPDRIGSRGVIPGPPETCG
jgi:hypothetical protein